MDKIISPALSSIAKPWMDQTYREYTSSPTRMYLSHRQLGCIKLPHGSTFTTLRFTLVCVRVDNRNYTDNTPPTIAVAPISAEGPSLNHRKIRALRRTFGICLRHQLWYSVSRKRSVLSKSQTRNDIEHEIYPAVMRGESETWPYVMRRDEAMGH